MHCIKKNKTHKVQQWKIQSIQNTIYGLKFLFTLKAATVGIQNWTQLFSLTQLILQG